MRPRRQSKSKMAVHRPGASGEIVPWASMSSRPKRACTARRVTVACSAVDQNVEVSFKRKCVFGLRNFELRSGCRTLDLEGLEGSLKRAI